VSQSQSARPSSQTGYPSVGLVRRYHTNNLMGRRPLPQRLTGFPP
jgi:hypothetical protein